MVKKRESTIRPYNAWTMSEAEFRAMIMSALREKSRWWKPKTRAVARTRIRKGIYKCESCWAEWPWKLPPLPWKKRKRNNADADHIKPVIPIEGFKTNVFLWYNWTKVIERLFVEESWYKTLCYECHSYKTKKENEARKKFINKNK